MSTPTTDTATCAEDSGSATGCRPVCDAPATHLVTHEGYRGPYFYRLCKRHAEYASARHYPDRVTFAPLTS